MTRPPSPPAARARRAVLACPLRWSLAELPAALLRPRDRARGPLPRRRARWSYASGERAGYVQKFSKKGWVCKTWEGEIAMANLPGAMPEVFVFTVRDEAVAAQINSQLGARVVLGYEQHLGLPSCFGETQYRVKSVRRVEP